MDFGWETGFLFGAALIAGGINAIAGGGGLLVFPALLLAGIAPLSANATAAASVWMGMVVSSMAYRQELGSLRHKLWPVTVASILGGTIGAILLLRFSDEGFEKIVPYLVATGTLLFTFAPYLIRISQAVKSVKPSNPSFPQPITLNQPALVIGQSAIALYGGFFGGGAGILMLSLLSLTNPGRLQTLQAVKIWMAICINAAALTYFVFANIISWPHVVIMAMGTSLGGYGGVYVAQKVPAIWLRRTVIAIGSSLTLYFFWAQT